MSWPAVPSLARGAGAQRYFWRVAIALVFVASACYGQTTVVGGSGSAAIACVGTPGNTRGTYRQQCQTTAGAIYACNNASGCTVAADWVASGSGAPSLNQLTDLSLSIVGGSAGVLTVSVPTGGTNVGLTNSDSNIPAATYIATPSGSWCSGSGVVYVSTDGTHINVSANASVTLSAFAMVGVTPGSNAATGFPAGDKEIGQFACGATANTWNSTTPTNNFAVAYKYVPAAGASGGLSITHNGTSDTFDIQRAKVPFQIQAAGAPGTVTGSQIGDIYTDTTAHATYICTVGSAPCTTWVATGGGGSSTAKVPLWMGSFINSNESAGGASNSHLWQIGGISGFEGCTNTSGGTPPEVCQIGMTNASGQNISFVFPWDTAIMAIDLHFVFGEGGSSGGNYRFTTKLMCNTLGTDFGAGTWTSGTTTTTGTFAALGVNITIAVNATGINIPTCAAGSLMSLNLTRDQTVASNSVDEARLYGGSIIATRTLP